MSGRQVKGNCFPTVAAISEAVPGHVGLAPPAKVCLAGLLPLPFSVSHVRGGNIPNYLGTDQPRTFKVKGDLLTVSEVYDSADGKRVQAKRVLRRIRR